MGTSTYLHILETISREFRNRQICGCPQTDAINLLRHRDKLPLGQAVEEAGRRRLRPILMTAATTMLAMLPLALGLGEGSEAQAPLARAVIGGLLSSTVITLMVVPLVYSLIGRKTLNPLDI